MQVSRELVDKVLDLFKPSHRYLQEVDVDYPTTSAQFLVNETEYMLKLDHLTDVEVQLCLNQLCYVIFGKFVLDKGAPGLEDLTFDQYLELRKARMFVKESHKKFRREIYTKELFDGRMEVVKSRIRDNIYIADLKFSLHEDAAVGELKLVLIK